MHYFCDSPAKISDLNIITRNYQIKKKMAYNLKNFQGYENQGKTKEILFQTETWQLNVVCNSEWSLGIKDDIRLNGKPGIGSEELVEFIDVKFPSKNGWTVVMWDNALVCRKHTLKYFEW